MGNMMNSISESSPEEVQEEVVLEWNEEHLQKWLKNNGFSDAVCVHFKGVTGKMLLYMDEQDLGRRNMSPQQVDKMMKKIAHLRKLTTGNIDFSSGPLTSNTTNVAKQPQPPTVNNTEAQITTPTPTQQDSQPNINTTTSAAKPVPLKNNTGDKTPDTPSTPMMTNSFSSASDLKKKKHVTVDKSDHERYLTVMKKLNKGSYKTSQDSFKHTFALRLSKPDELKDSYLAEDGVGTKQVLAEIVDDKPKPDNDSEDMDDWKELKKEKNIIEKLPTSVIATDIKILKIKLVVVEIPGNPTSRKLLAPILGAFDLSPQFGFFHTALVVGPWYLEWNNGELIIPRRHQSINAIVAIDLDEIEGESKVRSAIDAMARIICKWNGERTYSQTGTNCQHFTDELCDEIGIDLRAISSKSRSLEKFLSRLRHNGQCDLVFYLSPRLLELFKNLTAYQEVVQNKKIVFTSHQQLDNFVLEVKRLDPNYLFANPEDDALLKSFDRGFWLRYKKEKENPKYRPAAVDDDHLTTSCPYSHPDSTLSFY